MENLNSVFKKNYRSYLRQLNDVDLSLCESVLGITVDEDITTARIHFFETLYRVSQFGVVDELDQCPDYGICVILLKYLLMCPQHVPLEEDWVTFRDFADSGQTQNAGLSDYASNAISKRYAGNLSRLKAAVNALGGRPPETEYPYDLSTVVTARTQRTAPHSSAVMLSN